MNFLGMAVGSALGTALVEHAGVTGVASLYGGAALAAAALWIRLGSLGKGPVR